MRRTDKGFTAVELMVVMALLGVVVGLGFTSFGFLRQNFTSWQRRIAIEQGSRRVMAGLVYELRGAREIVQAEEHDLVFLNRNGNLVRVASDDNGVLRNGRRLLPTGNQADLRFRYLTRNGASLVDYQDVRDIAAVGFSLRVLDRREHSFELESMVLIRNKRMR